MNHHLIAEPARTSSAPYQTNISIASTWFDLLREAPQGATNERARQIKDWVWDFFAGGGGASRGIELATGRSPDYAINHCDHALQMHAKNHPATIHLKEDVWAVDLDRMRGGDVGLAWFSPDCTHFSKAKGSKPRSQKIRGLAFLLVKVAALRRPKIMLMENVQEFLSWGPLRQRIDAAGNPVFCDDGSPWMEPDPDRAGETFAAFQAALTTGLDSSHPTWDEMRSHLGECFPYEAIQRGLRYELDWKVLDAADYGAPTHRRRLVLVARSDGKAITWPAKTHGPGRRHPFTTADTCMDWSDLGTSIFDRSKPLAVKTCRRIARGVMRFVVNSPKPFLAPALAPADASNHGGLIAAWIAKHYGGVVGHRPDRPLGTITARDHHSLVTVDLTPCGVDLAAPPRSNLVAAFFSKYYGSGSCGQRANIPLHTITAKARFGLVTVLIDRETYAITDIRMRMAKPRELARCQGFTDDYVLIGSQQDQIARIGNSVPPPLAQAVVAANLAA